MPERPKRDQRAASRSVRREGKSAEGGGLGLGVRRLATWAAWATASVRGSGGVSSVVEVRERVERAVVGASLGVDILI